MPAYRRKLKKGFRWWYKFDFDGTTCSSTARYLTKKDCLKAERQAIEYYETKGDDASILEVCTHRLDYLNLSRSQEYFKDQRRLSKKIIGAFGNISIADITPLMASNLFLDEIKRCRDAGFGNTRPNELLKTLRTTISHARNNFGVEIKDPTRGIKKLPNDITTQFIPTEEMIEEVLESCNSDQKRLIQFVYETGCRVGESLTLDYKDVHDDYVTLYTRKAQNSQRTPRHLPRPDCIKKGKGKVFKHSAYPRFLEEKVKEFQHQGWNWHSLRRRRASIWAKDKPLFEIMMLLGHSQIATTQRYLFNIGIVKM